MDQGEPQFLMTFGAGGLNDTIRIDMPGWPRRRRTR
jgi:hypothetical protein